MQVLTSRARDCRERSTFVTLRHTIDASVAQVPADGGCAGTILEKYLLPSTVC
jgi:hypothetical protein